MIRISQIVDQSLWEYEQGNYKLAEAMLDFALRLAKKKKSTKYKGTSKNVPTNMALYNRVKSEAKRKFDVYPSAYANAWLVRTYRARGGGYRKKK
jgi:Family of unknown function (DUF5872)